MRATALASLLTVLSATAGLAIECPVDHAIYTQKTEGWVLKISAPGPEGAANQFAALRIEAPNGIARLEGGIYVPNGFGQVMAGFDKVCPDGESEDLCWSYEGALYSLGENGIEEFPVDFGNRSALAPQQVLLPDFAQGLWYSPLRGKAFVERDGENGPELNGPEDVFTLAACAK
jgi:hypothetical protein